MKDGMLTLTHTDRQPVYHHWLSVSSSQRGNTQTCPLKRACSGIKVIFLSVSTDICAMRSEIDPINVINS